MTASRAAVAAFLISPLVAALPIPALLDGSFNHYFELDPWKIVLPVAYGAAAILGIPAYLVLRHRLAYTKINFAGVGAAAAIVPAIMVFPKSWIALPFIAAIGVCGAVGGLVFWYLTWRSHL